MIQRFGCSEILELRELRRGLRTAHILVELDDDVFSKKEMHKVNLHAAMFGCCVALSLALLDCTLRRISLLVFLQ